MDNMRTDFNTFEEAMAKAKEIQQRFGFKTYVQEFYGFGGRFYSVLFWEED